MKLPDLIPGRSDVVVFLGAGVLLAYVGSGGWTEERWRQAGMAGGVIWAAAATGALKGEQKGFMRGFNTYNPDLHRNDSPEPIELHVPFDATPDLPIEPPEMAEPPVLPVVVAPPPPPRTDKRQVYASMRRNDLAKLARHRKLGGTWLSHAKKSEIIDCLIAGQVPTGKPS